MNTIYPVKRIKYLLAILFNFFGLSNIFFFIVSVRPSIRVVNYHATPDLFKKQFEQHLSYYSRYFHPVSPDDLFSFVFKKKWPFYKPGIILTFDDGLRDNYDVAAPILDKFNFHGWFFIPANFTCCSPEKQTLFAKYSSIHNYSLYCDQRIAISPSELRILSTRHEIGCHTKTHLRLSSDIDVNTMSNEIKESKKILSLILGREINSFCWVGGEENSYSAKAAEIIRESGYKYSFMTNNAPVTFSTSQFQIQRTNIEVSWPLSVVKFQVSGFLDIFYWRKRRRVNHLTDVL